jgi:hypothetical protein
MYNLLILFFIGKRFEIDNAKRDFKFICSSKFKLDQPKKYSFFNLQIVKHTKYIQNFREPKILIELDGILKLLAL